MAASPVANEEIVGLLAERPLSRPQKASIKSAVLLATLLEGIYFRPAV